VAEGHHRATGDRVPYGQTGFKVSTPQPDSWPEWDAAFGWASGGAEWVPVTRAWGFQKDVEIKLGLLLDAGIPACLHDRPYGEPGFAWPFGQVVLTSILVAPDCVDQANDLFCATFADEDGVFDSAGRQLEALRRKPSYRRLKIFWWAYLVFNFGLELLFAPFLVAVFAFWLARASYEERHRS
jgi:hypothetical protein